MMKYTRGIASVGLGLALAACLVGCPGAVAPAEFIAGGTGDPFQLADEASVEVFSPQTDLLISGGTPVEVNWRVAPRTRSSVVDVFFDVDENPDNGNEIVALNNLDLTETTRTLDTTFLDAGTYLIGVRIQELDGFAAADYAPGRITVNQRPTLFFTSPRDNFGFDRSQRISPSFQVAWEVEDPDSTVAVQLFLDPDQTPNGNELLLYTSTSQTGDNFTFDLPTNLFEPGTYRLLALVTDGVDTFAFYAPGSIQLRARLAGMFDLRDIHLPTSELRGAIFEGFNPRDNAGSFVSSMDDIDGDGFDDFIILAQFAKPIYEYNVVRTGVGEAYIIYGRSEPFSGLVNLNSTGTLFRGEFFKGVPEVVDPIRPSRGITSFATLSDWDSDGVREMAFGLPFTDSESVDLQIGSGRAPLDANGYFRSGAVIVTAGSSFRPDLGFPGRNVHGLAEFGTLVHEPFAEPPPCAESFYGPKAPFGLGATLFHRHITGIEGTPNEGSVRLGCRLSSIDFGDMFGESISTWDFDAVMVSAPNRDPSVAVPGAPSLAGAGLVTIYFSDVRNGFYPWSNVQAPPANAEFGYPGSLQSSGVTGLPHGGPYHYILDDIRPFQTPSGGIRPGAPGYYVDPDDSEPCAFGHSPFISTPEYSVRLWSDQEGARLSNVHGLGDFNADGLLDLVVGAPFTNEGAGACYLVLGRLRDLIRGGQLPVSELELPLNSSNPNERRIFDGIRIRGSRGDRLGQSQDDAGDFNGDGLADVIIGSPLLNSRQGGAAIFLGSRDVINLTQEDIPFDEIPARGHGVIFVGEEQGDLAGARVAGAGDVDGDGLNDILIAAPERSVQADLDLDGVIDIDREQCGVVYLIYGSPDLRGTLSLSLVGTAQLPGAIFVGRNSQDQLGAGLGEQEDRSFGIGGAGDVNGDGFGDLIFGAVRGSPRDRVRAGEAYVLYGFGD